MFICPECSFRHENVFSLSSHYRNTHQKTVKELYVAIFCNGVEPTCRCGCKEPVRFMDITRGFSEYKVGHISRIKNNFQTEKSKTNSLKTRRKMLETGEWKPFVNEETGKHWKDGLTAETDIRIARNKAAILANPEERKRRSEMMKGCWKDGRIQIKKGPDSSQWKGGISSLNQTCRANTRLYREWKFPKLQAANFKCTSCESAKNLEVHHDKETFSTIYVRIAEQMGYQKRLFEGLNPEVDMEMIELKFAISAAVADYHIQNSVSGIVLCEVCHLKLHDKLNF